MVRRIKAFIHDAPEMLPGTEPDGRELVSVLDGINYILVSSADGKTRLYRLQPGTMQNNTRDANAELRGTRRQRCGKLGWQAANWLSYQHRSGRGLECGVAAARQDRACAANPDRSRTTIPMTILTAIPVAIPVATSDFQATTQDRIMRRRRRTRDAIHHRRDDEIRAINATNRKHYAART